MKRLIMLLMLCPFFLTGFAQRVVSNETLKTTDLGNQKLIVADGEVYAILLKTGNRFEPYITVALGESDEAIKLLSNLYKMNPKRGDVIIFDNETDNKAQYSGASGYTVYSKGGHLSGHLRKPNIKGFIKAIKEYESSKDQEAK